MPLLPIRSKEVLLQQLRTTLESAGFAQTRPSSGVMLLTAPVVAMQAILEDKLAYQFDQSMIETAMGTNLDAIASRYGLARIESAKAHTQNFRFYTYNGGTYSSVKTGGMPDTASLPAGTYVFSPSNPQVRYKLTENVVFTATTTEKFAKVEAVQVGSSYRVEANVLTAHSVASVASVIWCTNPLPIDTGEDRETDQNLRYRITRRLQSLGGGTIEGLKSIIVSLPGIRDAQVVTNMRGPGTATITISGVTNPISQEVIDSVETVAKSYVAAGIAINVQVPKNIGVDLRMVAEPDDAGLREAVKSAVAQVFANIGVGETLQANDLIYAAYSAGADDADVVSMKIDGREVGGFNQSPPNGYRYTLTSIEVEPR